MSVERSDIEKLATLSRIAISDEDASEVQERLNSILGMIDTLQEADTDGLNRQYPHFKPYTRSQY